MAKKRKFKSAKAIPVAAGEPEDRISELADEVLHKILWQIDSPEQAAKCITLSSRWRSVWRSYPQLEFNQPPKILRRGNSFAEFAGASIEKFSRYNHFSIETVDITFRGSRQPPFRSSALEQLLELASERKAKRVMIKVRRNVIVLSYRFLSNSFVKTLQLSAVCLPFELIPGSLNLNSLKWLLMHDVAFGNDQTFPMLIASCPVLETLEIGRLDLMNLQVSNVNLKKLNIDSAWKAIQIEIEAPKLQMLNVSYSNWVTKLALVAPQLEHLEIHEASLSGQILQDVISKLPSLKFLALSGFRQLGGKELKLDLSSSPNLEEVKLCPSEDLDYIVLDAGPALSIFCLAGECKGDIPNTLEKCEIRNADACRWQVDVMFTTDEESHYELTPVGLTKSFIAKFPQFQTLSIRILDEPKVTFEEEEEEANDATIHPTVINHLKLYTDLCLKRDQEAILEAVFWICRPKFFTIIHEASTSKAKRFFTILLTLMSKKRSSSKKQGSKQYGKWRDQLKDVKITTRDVDRRGGGEEEKEEELIDVSTDISTLLATKKRVSFVLTWY